MVDEIRGNRTIVPTNGKNAIQECKRIDAPSPPIHRMHVKTQRLDGGKMLVDMGNHVDIVTGALSGECHRNAMSYEVPILSDEIDQHWVLPRACTRHYSSHSQRTFTDVIPKDQSELLDRRG